MNALGSEPTFRPLSWFVHRPFCRDHFGIMPKRWLLLLIWPFRECFPHWLVWRFPISFFNRRQFSLIDIFLWIFQFTRLISIMRRLIRVFQNRSFLAFNRFFRTFALYRRFLRPQRYFRSDALTMIFVRKSSDSLSLFVEHIVWMIPLPVLVLFIKWNAPPVHFKLVSASACLLWNDGLIAVVIFDSQVLATLLLLFWV